MGIAVPPIFNKAALVKTVKNSFGKFKDWTDDNRNLAIGTAAAAGLAALVSLVTIIPAWKAKNARNNRSGRNKKEGRFMKRAMDEYNGLDLDLDEDEFMEFLSALVDKLE